MKEQNDTLQQNNIESKTIIAVDTKLCVTHIIPILFC